MSAKAWDGWKVLSQPLMTGTVAYFAKPSVVSALDRPMTCSRRCGEADFAHEVANGKVAVLPEAVIGLAAQFFHADGKGQISPVRRLSNKVYNFYHREYGCKRLDSS